MVEVRELNFFVNSRTTKINWRFFVTFVSFLLVGFQLILKSEVGTDLGSFFFTELESLKEGHFVISNEVGNNKRRWLNRVRYTLETPAPQWTSTLPVLRSIWEVIYIFGFDRLTYRSNCWFFSFCYLPNRIGCVWWLSCTSFWTLWRL